MIFILTPLSSQNQGFSIASLLQPPLPFKTRPQTLAPFFSSKQLRWCANNLSCHRDEAPWQFNLSMPAAVREESYGWYKWILLLHMLYAICAMDSTEHAYIYIYVYYIYIYIPLGRWITRSKHPESSGKRLKTWERAFNFKLFIYWGELVSKTAYISVKQPNSSSCKHLEIDSFAHKLSRVRWLNASSKVMRTYRDCI